MLYATLPGCWGAIIFACLSFTPSLLPRGGLIQGIVCGITAATADLPFATDVPPGHGHTYTSEYVDGWNAVLRPVGITGQELAELRNIVAEDK